MKQYLKFWCSPGDPSNDPPDPLDLYYMFNILLISGQPVLVEISVSLRNILEIDEHRQVNIYINIF